MLVNTDFLQDIETTNRDIIIALQNLYIRSSDADDQTTHNFAYVLCTNIQLASTKKASVKNEYSYTQHIN